MNVNVANMAIVEDWYTGTSFHHFLNIVGGCHSAVRILMHHISVLCAGHHVLIVGIFNFIHDGYEVNIIYFI